MAISLSFFRAFSSKGAKKAPKKSSRPVAAAPAPSTSKAPGSPATNAKPQAQTIASPPPSNPLIEVFINDKPVSVPSGSVIIQACAEAGVEIPRFCYHDRLAIAGNCRMCLVQVEKMPKLVASCAQPIQAGMRVITDSPAVKKAREGVMEFLLANHPLDCPICDQGGECDLQDQAMAYGVDRSRYNLSYEQKRAVEDKDFGPLIKTSMNRCIHCTRCVRFANEIAGLPELGTTGRGNDMQIGTYVQQMLGSELSANIIDLCPVGALTSRPYAFAARPWELRRVESIDVLDAVGSAIRIDSRGDDVLRVLPRENAAVNEEWLADKSRFAIDGLKHQRLTKPMIDQRPVKWSEALSAVSTAIASGLKESSIAAVAGPFADVESLVAGRDLLANLGCLQNLYLAPSLFKLRATANAVQDLPAEHTSLYRSNLTLDQLEHADAVLLIGNNLRHEAPLMNARIRKAFLKAANWAGGFIGGEKNGSMPNLNWDCEWLGCDVAALKKLTKSAFWKRFSERSERPAIVISNSVLMEHADGAVLWDQVSKLVNAMGERLVRPDWNGVCLVPRGASHVAALELGWRGNSMADKRKLQDCKVLLMIGSADSVVDQDGFLSSARADQIRIYLGHHADTGALSSHVILPTPAYTEKSATWVNLEGRVQSSTAASVPLGEAREDWQVLRAIGDFAGVPMSYATADELRLGRLKMLSPSLAETSTLSGKMHQIIPASSWIAGLLFSSMARVSKSSGHVPATPLGTTSIPDYYMTDVISRASPTLAKCSIAFSMRSCLAPKTTEEVDLLYQEALKQ